MQGTKSKKNLKREWAINDRGSVDMNQNKTVRLNIRLTEDLKNKIQKKAKEENRTMSNYIENLVKRDLEKGDGR